MTRFQKQVLLKEEQRQTEQAQNQSNGGTTGSGALNARSGNGNTRVETTRYVNENKFETENQAEFVD